MKKFLSVAFVCVVFAYLLSACVTEPPENGQNDGNTVEKNLRNGQDEGNTVMPSEKHQFFPGDPKQQALVIGNGKYEQNPLTTTVNDATDMANVLHKQGFTVTIKTNLIRSEMEVAIRQFKKRLYANQKAVGLFYFSGHGAQVDGTNYLIPINNTAIVYDDDVEWKAVDVDKILAQMQDNNNGLNIIILDACRDNPYISRDKSKYPNGFATTTAPEGSIIAYATAPGKTASSFMDKNDRNSLYTRHLLKAIQSRIRIDDVLMEVGKGVQQDSKGEQIPWYHASMTKLFCFGGCP
jgi:uncharacterized caspase-like protein